MAAKKSPRMDWLDAVLQAEPDLLHATDRALCVSLWSHMGSSGVCYPSQERVARVAGMSRRNAQTGLKRLEELGWIEREKANTERAQKKLQEKAESSGRASNPDPRQHVYWARIPEESAPIKPEIGDESAPKQAKNLRTEQYQGTKTTNKHTEPDGSDTLDLLDDSPRTNNAPANRNGKHSGPDAAQVRELFATVDGARLEALHSRGTPARNLQPTKSRLGHIRARLREGYSVDELERAADAFLASDWHLRRGFSDPFQYALGDDAKLQRWLTDAERLKPKRIGPPVDEVDIIEAAARAEPRPTYAAGGSS